MDHDNPLSHNNLEAFVLQEAKTKASEYKDISMSKEISNSNKC